MVFYEVRIDFDFDLILIKTVLKKNYMLYLLAWYKYLGIKNENVDFIRQTKDICKQISIYE